MSDPLRLLRPDPANLHEHVLIGCDDALHRSELPQEAVRQRRTNARQPLKHVQLSRCQPLRLSVVALKNAGVGLGQSVLDSAPCRNSYTTTEHSNDVGDLGRLPAVFIEGASGTTIGGGANHTNVLSANITAVHVLAAAGETANQNRIETNLIGTSADGLTPLPNNEGILLQANPPNDDPAGDRGEPPGHDHQPRSDEALAGERRHERRQRQHHGSGERRQQHHSTVLGPRPRERGDGAVPDVGAGIRDRHQ